MSLCLLIFLCLLISLYLLLIFLCLLISLYLLLILLCLLLIFLKNYRTPKDISEGEKINKPTNSSVNRKIDYGPDLVQAFQNEIVG
jgi:Flp pilus assembly protein TadB